MVNIKVDPSILKFHRLHYVSFNELHFCIRNQVSTTSSFRMNNLGLQEMTWKVQEV